MADPALQTEPLSFDEYLALESTLQLRHELVDGEIRAMGGGTDVHNLIATAMGFALRSRLRAMSSPCRVFIGDVKVRAGHNGRYPDVFVSCAREDNHALYKEQPLLIAGVLSDSTQKEDRGQKFNDYRQLTSLQDYLLIAQSAVHIEHFRREENDSWQQRILLENDTLILSVFELQIPVCEIYEDVLNQLSGVTGE
jgi:Uma2 family endonuclease